MDASALHFLYEEDNGGVFLLVTVFLGGGAAFLAGRAVAATWRPAWQILAYALVLAAAVRFMHFALFGGTLLAPYYYGVDAAVCLGLALLGFRLRRVRQMIRQYPWINARAGMLGWKRRGADADFADPGP